MTAMKAQELLTKAADLISERGAERDQSDGERSMARCVEAFNAMTDHMLSTEEGWMFMTFLKLARMQGGAFKADDYEDAIAYSALMAEEALHAYRENPFRHGLSPEEMELWNPGYYSVNPTAWGYTTYMDPDTGPRRPTIDDFKTMLNEIDK